MHEKEEIADPIAVEIVSIAVSLRLQDAFGGVLWESPMYVLY